MAEHPKVPEHIAAVLRLSNREANARYWCIVMTCLADMLWTDPPDWRCGDC
jgi:hypothetical protein